MLIAAHGNSLRALIMYLENLSEQEIVGVNLPTGIPLVYRLNDDFSVFHKEFLGNAEEVAAKMQKVANQGSATK